MTRVGYRIVEVEQDDRDWTELLDVAPSIHEAVIRQLTLQIDHARSNHILAAMSDDQPVGVLRFVTQRLGEDKDRPPIVFKGKTLIEGKVFAFGVLPGYQNQGIGRALQESAIELARGMGCYQLRSRSWYRSQANLHLKISMGSGIQPSLKDDIGLLCHRLVTRGANAGASGSERKAI
jgi:GNAT superfamily N-acetyltransferase